jgi:PD-(D/E)XK nuclease superfamily
MIGYERHSPSALNLFAASPSMFVLERILGLKQPVGVPAHRGVAVEDGVAHALKKAIDAGNIEAIEKEAINIALTKYDTLAAMSPDDRREKYRATIPEMVSQAIDELKGYGIPSATQGFVEWKPEGLRLPIVGYFDFKWEQHGIITDLKTTERMPSEIKIPHARQVGLYASSDNMDARLTYVTPKKCHTYRLENVREHREALYQIAKRVENFLALSDDPQFFLNITAPDVESFYWTTPAARQLAFDNWSI